MWSGSVASIPAGWALCNGQNGTPNLQDRFIVGAGSSYNPSDVGGVASVTLTTAQMPAHNHSVATRTYSSGGGGQGPWPFVGGPATTGGSISMNTAGEDQPHENRPPYYALAYIMRTI
jgi:microcystin-dependent protein